MNNRSKHIGQLVLDEQKIREGVTKVAQKLNSLYQEAVIITVVPGGILFTADLVRELTFDLTMDYISCPHTPGDRNNSSSIVYHQNIDITGKDVIVIDDAIESGGTMKRLVEHLQANYPIKSLAIATLFVKPGRVDIPVTQHFAYEMENDDLLVGYGLPWQDKLRNVPYVSKLVK
ncbi:phosphoribosyltransferase [Parendozoicomonas haliclonae]|uniref:Hypoxanthine phosphoribosyltransferase n=1 Tax=Parendozoicomonas haliclonae TaxID=1960125 RepID=A0A1X7AGT0_9GAMM|nr:phosphoribosyltransferase family protein [Parendozoicomonas haliclonae]SMA39447.1 Hypoxanthine phosphoribosyltransferase [Parendozoicomonas haliclonae]